MSNYTYKNIGMGPINYGHDFNFFDKITVTNTIFNATADSFIPFVTQGVILLNETASTVVQVSFNGTTIHDELDSSNLFSHGGFEYNNRVVGKIWLKIGTGASAVVSIRAWAVR
jgi:hypothetical protein